MIYLFVSGHGGAIFINTTSGFQLMSSCTFSLNTAYNSLGVDIYDGSANSAQYYSAYSVFGCVSTSSGNSLLYLEAFQVSVNCLLQVE
jgi:hypothetical protein